MVFSCQGRSHTVIFKNGMFSFAKNALCFTPHCDMGKASLLPVKDHLILPTGTLLRKWKQPLPRIIHILERNGCSDCLLKGSSPVPARMCCNSQAQPYESGGWFLWEAAVCHWVRGEQEAASFGGFHGRNRLKKKRNKCTPQLPDSWSPTKPTEPFPSISPSLPEDAHDSSQPPHSWSRKFQLWQHCMFEGHTKHAWACS